MELHILKQYYCFGISYFTCTNHIKSVLEINFKHFNVFMFMRHATTFMNFHVFRILCNKKI